MKTRNRRAWRRAHDFRNGQCADVVLRTRNLRGNPVHHPFRVVDKMTDIKVRAPKINKLLPESGWEEAFDEEDASVRAVCVEGGQATSDGRVIFDGVLFRKTDFRGFRAPASELLDVVFEGCDLSNADFSRSSLHRCEFRGTKLTGAIFSESMLRDVKFSDCGGRYSSFNFSKLRQVVFEGCELESADFVDCSMKGVAFGRNRLDDISFLDTSLDGIDLTKAEFSRITVTPSKLPGCKVTREQAIGFARTFGLVVEED